MIKTYNYNDNTKLSEHFSASEFRCKCGRDHEFKVDDSLISNLEKLFSKLDCSKIIVTSGYRCVQHDKNVGGSGSGQHVEGTAADICCYGQDGKPISSKLVCCAAQDIGFKGIANINTSYQYTHVDMRVNGKWYGNEVVNYNTVTDDFYKYFNIPKEDKSVSDTAKKGIDISFYQDKIDWSKVAVDFIILKAGQKDYTDPKFEQHYASAEKAGIPVGAYWYGEAKTVEDAEKEAEFFIERLKNKKFAYPVYYDVEGEMLNLSNDLLSKIVMAFLSRVEKEGYWVGLYMSGSPMHDKIADSVRNRFAVWVADIRGKKPDYITGYGMWQYSWKGNISGITGDVDLDYCYVDYPQQIKANGLNGFGKSNPADTEKPTATVEPPKDNDSELDIEVTIGGVKYKGKVEKV